MLINPIWEIIFLLFSELGKNHRFKLGNLGADEPRARGWRFSSLSQPSTMSPTSKTQICSLLPHRRIPAPIPLPGRTRDQFAATLQRSKRRHNHCSEEFAERLEAEDTRGRSWGRGRHPGLHRRLSRSPTPRRQPHGELSPPGVSGQSPKNDFSSIWQVRQITF